MLASTAVLAVALNPVGPLATVTPYRLSRSLRQVFCHFLAYCSAWAGSLHTTSKNTLVALQHDFYRLPTPGNEAVLRIRAALVPEALLLLNLFVLVLVLILSHHLQLRLFPELFLSFSVEGPSDESALTVCTSGSIQPEEDYSRSAGSLRGSSSGLALYTKEPDCEHTFHDFAKTRREDRSARRGALLLPSRTWGDSWPDDETTDGEQAAIKPSPSSPDMPTTEKADPRWGHRRRFYREVKTAAHRDDALWRPGRVESAGAARHLLRAFNTPPRSRRAGAHLVSPESHSR